MYRDSFCHSKKIYWCSSRFFTNHRLVLVLFIDGYCRVSCYTHIYYNINILCKKSSQFCNNLYHWRSRNSISILHWFLAHFSSNTKKIESNLFHFINTFNTIFLINNQYIRFIWYLSIFFNFDDNHIKLNFIRSTSDWPLTKWSQWILALHEET